MNLTMSPVAGKRIRIAVRKRKVRQPHRPVGKLEFQAVPTFAAPAFGDPLPLQHQMRQPALLQAVAHHEAGLAAADHQRLYLFIRHGSGPCGARRARAAARMIQRRNAAKSRCPVRKPR